MNQELIKETQKLLSFESYPGKEKEVSDYVEILMKKLGFRDVFRDEYGSIFGFIGPKKDFLCERPIFFSLPFGSHLKNFI